MNDVILALVARNLIPFIVVYSAHVVAHGHLSPGGGFSGGTIAAAAAILAVLVWGLEGTGLCYREEALCGMEAVSLLGYVSIGAVAWVSARPFLANLTANFPAGQVGGLFSSGAVWILGAIIGLKVGVTITGLFNRLSGTAEELMEHNDD